jgi:hypothetical protein
MLFYYDPILGLQYRLVEQELHIDLTVIPKDYDKQELLDSLMTIGVPITDYSSQSIVMENHTKIISNL